jgi:hypothetical protein
MGDTWLQSIALLMLSSDLLLDQNIFHLVSDWEVYMNLLSHLPSLYDQHIIASKVSFST